MNQQVRVAPQAAGAPVALPAASYWRYIVPLAGLMTAIIGARAHEGVPLLNRARPALVLGLLGGIVALWSTSRPVIVRALNDTVFKGIAIYLAWVVMTVPFALWRGGAFEAARGVMPALALAFVLLLCPPTRKTYDMLQRSFVLGAAATGCMALLFGASDAEGRLTTQTTLDANDLAATMAMSLPLAMGLVSRERSLLLKLTWLVVCALEGAVMVKAGSRGGFIALTLGTLIFVLGQRGSRRLLFLGLCVGGAAAAWSVASPVYRHRIVDLLHNDQTDYNYTDYFGRKQVWKRARGYIREHPITGVGVGNFPIAEGQTCRRTFPGQGCKWSAPHNAWLQAGSELGIPGMILYVLMLLRGARVAWTLWVPRAREQGMHTPELLAALIGFATASTFLSHAYFYLMFALLGLIGIAGITRRETTRFATVPRPLRGPVPFAPVRAGPPPGVVRRPFSGPVAGPLAPVRHRRPG